MTVRGAGDDIAAFAARAQAGEQMVYGRGERPPREVVRAMAPLVEAGILSPVSKREAGGHLFMVQRTSMAFGARGPSRGRVRRRRITKSSFSLVLDCIVQAARRGMPCPTNDELAARCGLSGKVAASYRVRRLVATGRIAVEDRSPLGRRVVTILTGIHAGKATVEAAL